MASAITTSRDDADAKMVGPIALPHLPNEIWLQILEHVDDIEFLWCTARILSRDYRAFVDCVFAVNFVPIISVSLSLPRHDPATGYLAYTHAIPKSEVVFESHISGITAEHISLEIPATLATGITTVELTASGAFVKQRLDEAQAWMWFGRNRGKGTNIIIRKDVQWSVEKKTWVWKVSWTTLVNRYFCAKQASRKLHRRPGKDVSIPLRLR